MMLTLFQSHSMSRILPTTSPERELALCQAASDDSSTTLSSSHSSDDKLQPLKLIRSSSVSAKLNKTFPPLSRRRRPHRRRSDILVRTRSAGLLLRRTAAKQVSPFTSPIHSNSSQCGRYFPRQCSEITMSDFNDSTRSLLGASSSCSLSFVQDHHTPATMPPSQKESLWNNDRREHAAPPLAPVRAPSLSTINFFEDDEDEEESLSSIPRPILKPIREGYYNSSSSFSSFLSPSTDEPSGWSPNISKGDEHSVQDTPAMPPSLQEESSLGNNNRHEHPVRPAPLLAPVRAPSLSTINFEDDHEDEESLCSSIPRPILKPIREGYYGSSPFQQSPCSSVVGASQDSA
jgi:hypothetical protein